MTFYDTQQKTGQQSFYEIYVTIYLFDFIVMNCFKYYCFILNVIL